MDSVGGSERQHSSGSDHTLLIWYRFCSYVMSKPMLWRIFISATSSDTSCDSPPPLPLSLYSCSTSSLGILATFSTKLQGADESQRSKCTTPYNTHLCGVKIKRATGNPEQSAFHAVNRDAVLKEKKERKKVCRGRAKLWLKFECGCRG